MFGAAGIARLATVGGEPPHSVPSSSCSPATRCTRGRAKPKRTTALQRLANVAAHPAVAVLVDHYDDDAGPGCGGSGNGRARILTPGAGRAMRPWFAWPPAIPSAGANLPRDRSSPST